MAYNLTKLHKDDYFEIANHYQLPLHLAYIMVNRIIKEKPIAIETLSSTSYYAICRDVLVPYKNKAFIFQRYFNFVYPYLRNTDTRLEWFLKLENGLSLSQKITLLEGETSFTSMGVGKILFERALKRVNFDIDHEMIEKKRLMEYDGEWALTICSFIEKERGDLTAAEVLLTADELAEETRSSIKVSILSYLLSRMGKIEVYFIAQQIRKFHDQISRTTSLIRAFANVFEHDVKMLERLVSMHSMTDVAWLVENKKPLIEYQKLLPFRTFRPMLAAKWMRNYQFPSIVEGKYDGIRLLIHKLGNRVQCFSRRRKNYTNKFPIITNFKDIIPAYSIILDGEIIGIKWSMTGPKYANVYELHESINHNLGNFVLRYVIFDVLFFNGFETVKLPFSKRKQIRHQIANQIQSALKQRNNPIGIEISEVDAVEVHSKDQLIQIYNQFLDAGLEGAIVKNPHGTYELGKRSQNWYKLKPKETLDVTITGAIPIQGNTGIRVWGFRYAVKREEEY
ncbi:MAG: ATP-dependent DNA ligase, partial [Candidatus Kariarchaeaceae archaeon]